MVDVDCTSCEGKGCCTFRGWKVFFLHEEKELVLKLYGQREAEKIEQFQTRTNGHPIFAVTLPCPFFKPTAGLCGIYEARPLACRAFPVEIEPVTGTTYLDQAVCPKRSEAQFNPELVQIATADWCEKFWQVSPKQKMSNKCPVLEGPPKAR